MLRKNRRVFPTDHALITCVSNVITAIEIWASQYPCLILTNDENHVSH